MSAERDWRKACGGMSEQKKDQKKSSIEEMKRKPVSDPEKFKRCDYCGEEMPIADEVCLSCLPF